MKNVLFKQRTIPIEVNFLSWKKIPLLNKSLWNFFVRILIENFDEGGEGVVEKSPNQKQQIDQLHEMHLNSTSSILKKSMKCNM